MSVQLDQDFPGTSQIITERSKFKRNLARVPSWDGALGSGISPNGSALFTQSGPAGNPTSPCRIYQHAENKRIEYLKLPFGSLARSVLWP